MIKEEVSTDLKKEGGIVRKKELIVSFESHGIIPTLVKGREIEVSDRRREEVRDGDNKIIKRCNSKCMIGY